MACTGYFTLYTFFYFTHGCSKLKAALLYNITVRNIVCTTHRRSELVCALRVYYVCLITRCFCLNYNNYNVVTIDGFQSTSHSVASANDYHVFNENVLREYCRCHARLYSSGEMYSLEDR